jgi:wyosine [tRNA(Phe)-imidazoG37] synthetase (radical SAM superfamily)
LKKILAGCKEFAIKYNGNLVTETMLISGINDSDESLKSTAEFISALNPSTSYITIPTRPPAVDWVNAPDTTTINKAYQIFESSKTNVELITGYEGNEFAFSGDVKNDLLSITSVHPMRKDAVMQFLAKANSDWAIIQPLIDEKKIVELEYKGEKFYLRNLKKMIKPTASQI